MAILTYADSYGELNALFTAVFTGAWNTVVQNAAAPATNLYVSLHNADPGPTGTQTTNETAYTNYARIAVARTTGGWTVTQGSGTTFSNVVNAATITFAQCGASGDTLTHWGVGLSLSGTGTLLAFGSLGPVAGPAIPWTVTAAAPGVITCPGYSPTLNDRVSVWNLPGTESIPAAYTEGTIYFAVAVGTNTCELATTASGTGITTATVGSGIMYKCGPLVVSSGITPSFAAGAFSIQKA